MRPAWLIVIILPVAEPSSASSPVRAGFSLVTDTSIAVAMRLIVDEGTRPMALSQIGSVDAAVARDIALHVDLWFVRGRERALQWIHGAGGRDLTSDDLDLVAELLNDAAQR